MANAELIKMAKLLQQQEYDQVLSSELDPTDDWSFLQSKLIQAMAYEKISKFNEAIECYVYALEHGDKSPFNRYTINLLIALCHKSSGNILAARDCLLRCMDAASEDIRIEPNRVQSELATISAGNGDT